VTFELRKVVQLPILCALHMRISMRRAPRPVRTLFAAAFVSFVAIAVPAWSQAPLSASSWPQVASDIPVDPALKLGTLPNGMRYAIMKNTTPKGEVSIRLRIAAGSLHETEAQRGLAHFVEHMAFRGTTNVPDGELFKTLERLGLRAGADTNASTGELQTIYQMDLPNIDEQTIDTGLMISREIVSEILFSADAFEAERGPVLSEERLRDGPGMRAYVAHNGFLLKGQLAADRMPIGKVDVLQNAPVSELTGFYRTYYRPERTQIVVVGDIDPAAIEAKIRARFADWMPAGSGRPDPDFGTPAQRSLEALVFSETGAPQYASVAWMTPYDGSLDTKERRRRNLVESIGLSIINQRLAQAAQMTDAPFLSAGVSRGNRSRSVRMASLQVNYAADRWQRALLEADKIRRQVLEQGVTQQEVDRQVTNIIAGAEAEVASASTRTSRGIIGSLVGTISRDAVFDSPESSLEMVKADLNGLTAERINEVLKMSFVGTGPLLFLSSTTPVEGGESALVSVFREAENATLADGTPPDLPPWPYTSFGTPGTVVETRRIEDLDTTFIRFANGVKLTVKSTDYRADQILVGVSLAGGELAMPKDKQIVNIGGYLGGGLEAMPFIDIRRTLPGKIYGISFDVEDDAFSFSGATRPADLDTQMQVLAAFLTKPGWRPDLFNQGLSSLSDGLAKLDINPMSLFGAKLSGFLHSGDVRWETPSLDEVANAKLEDVRAVVEPALKNAPIEVTIVGDISVEEATRSVAATLGALPPRQSAAIDSPRAGDVKFPAPTATPVVLHHRGRPDQGAAAIAWPTTDVFADSEAAARRLLVNIMQLRLVEELRVQAGATYSPSTTAHASLTFPGYGYIGAYAEIPPDKAHLFYETVDKVTADLRENGPTADEFERARKPELDSLERAVETNGFWRSFLAGSQADERRLELIRQARPRLEQVTAQDVQRVAQKYLRNAMAWKLMVTPRP
jgi:zinc protease